MKNGRVKLGELCNVVTKGTTPTSLGYAFVSVGIPFLRIQNLGNSTVSLKKVLYINEETHQALKRSIIKPKDFLITIAGTIGRVAIVPDDFPECNCNQAVAILRFDQEKLYPQYLLHWLSTNDAIGQISGKKVTATISNLSLGQIKELEIPLPPLAEQKRIAGILDKADNLRRKRQQAIKLADEFLRAVFLDMFGDPVTNPKEWKHTSLGSLVIDWTPGVTIQPNEFTEKGFPVLHKGAVQRNGKLKFDTRKKTHTSYEFAESNIKAAIDGDYIAVNLRDLVPTGPSIGLMSDLSRYGDKKYLLAYGAYGFKVDRGAVSPEYLVALTNQKGFRKELAKVWVGSTQIHIRKDDFFQLKIPFPDYELQHKYQLIVDRVRSSLANSMESFCSEDLFYSLSQKAFAGEL